jgi:hypothetical protein
VRLLFAYFPYGWFRVGNSDLRYKQWARSAIFHISERLLCLLQPSLSAYTLQ